MQYTSIFNRYINTYTLSLLCLDLPYDSLISCASTSRTILHDALPLVTTLHIEKASHLRIGIVSNHLRDVRTISICNLINENNVGGYVLDKDIATKSVFFLSKFPYLERVTFRGKGGYRFNPLSSYNEDQMATLYHLLDSFSGAFDSNFLPQTLQIVGLHCPHRIGVRSNCKTCNRICSKFPFDRILDIDLCLSYASMKETIESRLGGRDYLQSGTRFFMHLLSKGRVARTVMPHWIHQLGVRSYKRFR